MSEPDLKSEKAISPIAAMLLSLYISTVIMLLENGKTNEAIKRLKELRKVLNDKD